MPFPVRSAPLLGQLASIADRLEPILIVPLHADPPPLEHDQRAALPSHISNELAASGSAFTSCNNPDTCLPNEISPAPGPDSTVVEINAGITGDNPPSSDGNRQPVLSQQTGEIISNSSNGAGEINALPCAVSNTSAAQPPLNASTDCL